MGNKSDNIAVTLRADARPMMRGLRQAGGAVTRFGKRVDYLGARMRAAKNALVGRMGGMFGMMAGAYALAKFTKDAKDFGAVMTDIGIRANMTAKAQEQMRKKTIAVSSSYGIAKEQVAEFVRKYVELTGQADPALKMMNDMAQVSLATGAKMSDLATIVDNLNASFGITAKEAGSAFAVLRKQEKLGSVGFEKIAQFLPGLAATAGTTFGQRGIKGVQNVGAMVQMAARSTGGNAAQAATATRRFMEQLAANRKKIEKVTGQKLTTKEGKWKDLQDIAKIIGHSMNVLDKDKQAKLSGALGIRGVKLARAFAQADKAGWTNKVGERASASTLFGAKGKGVIAQDLKRRMQSDAFQFQKAMTLLKNEMYKGLLPVVKTLAKEAPKLAKYMPYVSQVLKVFTKNLGITIGALAAFKAYKVIQAFRSVGKMDVNAGVVNVSGAGGVPGGVPGGTTTTGTVGAMGMMAKVAGIAVAGGLVAQESMKFTKGEYDRQAKARQAEAARMYDPLYDPTKAMGGSESDSPLLAPVRWLASKGDSKGRLTDLMSSAIRPSISANDVQTFQKTNKLSPELQAQAAAFAGMTGRDYTKIVQAIVEGMRKAKIDVTVKPLSTTPTDRSKQKSQ